MTGVLAVVALSIPGLGYGQAAEDGHVPIRHAARPLTLVDGLFRLDFFVGGGQIDRRDLAFQLAAGAGYGISDDFEIGLVLIDAVVSPAQDSGLGEPFGYLRYRLLSGPLQIAGQIEGQLPTDGQWRFEAAVPLQLSILRTIRFDLIPQISAEQVPDWTGFWSAEAELSVQILDVWRIYAGGRSIDEISGPFEPLVQPLGGTVVTLTSDRRPLGDLDVRVQGPAYRLGTDRTIARTLQSDWFFVVAYRPFIRSRPSRFNDAFSEPTDW